jgi:hypothetical protein
VAGGKPDIVMMSPYVKTVFSTFMADANVVPLRLPLSGRNQATIIAAADTYLSDFGLTTMVPNRQMARAGASVARNAFGIDKSKWAIGVLRPIQRDNKVAKTSDALPGVLKTEWSLISRNEAQLRDRRPVRHDRVDLDRCLSPGSAPGFSGVPPLPGPRFHQETTMVGLTREQRAARDAERNNNSRLRSGRAIRSRPSGIACRSRSTQLNAIDERKPDWRPATLVNVDTQETAPDNAALPATRGGRSTRWPAGRHHREHGPAAAHHAGAERPANGRPGNRRKARATSSGF